MNILQDNTNRSTVANDLMKQIIYETKGDIVMISEPYKNRDDTTWFLDDVGTAAIWVIKPNRDFVNSHRTGNSIVWIESSHIIYVNFYLTTNDRMEDFRLKVNEPEDAIQNMNSKLIVDGDFKAKAIESGMVDPDSREKYNFEMALRLDLVFLISGSSTTFRRPGYRETTIDITIASESLAGTIQEWQVIEDNTASNHQYITFSIMNHIQSDGSSVVRLLRWNVERMGSLLLK